MQWTGKITNLKPESLDLANKAKEILDDYQNRVTLRQVFYRLVAANVIENTHASYRRFQRILDQARRSGLISWHDIEDRNRSIETTPTYASPEQIIELAREQYDEDRWVDQRVRVGVIVEKSALAGVLQPICHRWQVPFCAARGYASSTLVYEVAQRMRRHVILYLGDHDSSGVDMRRDWQEKLDAFLTGSHVEVIALTDEQIDTYQLPPQAAKTTDPRSSAYAKDHGKQSWELDALAPSDLELILNDHIEAFIDADLWAARDELIEHNRQRIQLAA